MTSVAITRGEDAADMEGRVAAPVAVARLDDSAEAVAAYARELADASPALSQAQRARLARLLGSSGGRS